MNTLNIIKPTLTVDVVDLQPMLNVVQNQITLDIESGGAVPAAIDTTLEASTNLSALRAITTDANGKAKYADVDTIPNAMVIGISTTSASTGQNITIKTSGQLTDQYWTWNKGIIFLSTNGQLTQTAPTNGAYVVPIGRAITSTTIIIDIDTIIQTV